MHQRGEVKDGSAVDQNSSSSSRRFVNGFHNASSAEAIPRSTKMKAQSHQRRPTNPSTRTDRP